MRGCRAPDLAPNPLTTGREAGFTLIEVMVALAVFSLSVIALLNLQTETTRATRFIEDKALAEIVAENALAEIIIQRGFPEADETEVMVELGGQSFRVERQISETGDVDLRRIEVAVYFEAGGQELYSLIGLKGRN